MRDASAQELLLLSALQECRMRLEAAREGEAAHQALQAELRAALAREADLAAALASERQRTEAVRLVLGAVLASLGRFGLRKGAFQAQIARASRDTPDSGPESARHPVLLAESRRVLGIAAGPDGG